jgi:hypothetical protein
LFKDVSEYLRLSHSVHEKVKTVLQIKVIFYLTYCYSGNHIYDEPHYEQLHFRHMMMQALVTTLENAVVYFYITGPYFCASQLNSHYTGLSK